MGKRTFSKPPKRGPDGKPRLRLCTQNHNRVARILSLLARDEVAPFDFRGEALSSCSAQFSADHVLITLISSQYKITRNAMQCFLDVPMSTAADCLGIGETLFKEIKKTFYEPRWPCADIYRNALPRHPEYFFSLRREYMRWLRHPKNKDNTRLLFAMQLAERASIAHQRLLPVGSVKCDVVRQAESAGQSFVGVMVPFYFPGPPADFHDERVQMQVQVEQPEEQPEEKTEEQPQEKPEEQREIDDFLVASEEQSFIMDEFDNGTVSVLDASTGQDIGDIYNSLFD